MELLRIFVEKNTPLQALILPGVESPEMWPRLKELLQEWPARRDLVEFDVFRLAAWETKDVLLEYHEFFPSLQNLTAKMQILDVLDQLPPYLRNITALSLEEPAGFNQGWVQAMARNLPLLSDLTLDSGARVDLSELKDVTALSAPFGCVSRFPPELKHLSSPFREDDDSYRFSTSDIAQAIAALEQVGATLERLSLPEFPPASLSKLLNSLPNLLELSVTSFTDGWRARSVSEAIVLSHPKLREVELPHSSWIPEYMPSLTIFQLPDWICSGEESGDTFDLTRRCPSVSSLRIYQQVQFRKFQHQLHLLPGLSRLSIATPPPDELLPVLRRLPGLKTLWLGSGGERGPSCRWSLVELLGSLSGLRILNIRQFRGDLTIPEGFTHPLLVQLSITAVPERVVEADRRFEIRFGGRALPSLEELALAVDPHSSSDKPWGIFLDDLPRLQTMSFLRTGHPILSGAKLAKLAVVGCPSLASIGIEDLRSDMMTCRISSHVGGNLIQASVGDVEDLKVECYEWPILQRADENNIMQTDSLWHRFKASHWGDLLGAVPVWRT